MSLFSGAKHSAFDHSIFNAVGRDQFNITTYNSNTLTLDKILGFVGSHVAPNAFYNSEQRYPPPNCLPGTRTEILADLEDWFTDRTTDTRVYWIQGRAGVGKSAIMQNVSERYARPLGGETYARLAGAFFFSRNDPTRDKLDPFVATIVYQFLRSEPLRAVLGPLITEVIRSDPKIFDTTFENQFRKLILEPCSKVEPEAWNTLPNVVVIDGVDECILIPSQERLIAVIGDALPECRLAFLIASRPEPRICRAFDYASFVSFLGRLPIGDSAESTQDIAAYFHQRFAQLQDTHHALRHIDTSWPSENVVWQLVGRASGQFIFAVTIMKYLESDDSDPEERLEDILHIGAEDLPESPYSELDLLYLQILRTCSHWDAVRSVLRLVLTITHVGSLYVWTKDASIRAYMDSSCSPEYIATLLGFKPGKVQILLYRLHAVIQVPQDDKNEIRIPHASFSEFLLDHKRSRDYHIILYTPSEHHDMITQSILRSLALYSQQFWSCFPDRCPSPKQFKETHKHYFSRAQVDVFGVAQPLTSVSAELMTALNEFDPYAFAVMVLNSDRHSDGRLPWMNTIQWAKALDNRVPQRFIEKMESFIRSFCLASPRGTSLQLWEAMGYMEEDIYAKCNQRSLWNEILGLDSFNQLDSYDIVYVLPANQPLPPSWTSVTVTREKSERIARLLDSLACCDRDVLVNDIRKDTFESIHGFPDQENDLYALKKMVKERRQEMGLEPSSRFTAQNNRTA